MDMMHHHSHEHEVYEFNAYWEELLVKFICDYLDMLRVCGVIGLRGLETIVKDLIERKV